MSLHVDLLNLFKDDLIPPELSSKVHGRVNEYLQQRLDDPAFHSRLYVNEQDQFLAVKASPLRCVKAELGVLRLLFFPVDNSRSTEKSKSGLARLRRILDELALESAEARCLCRTSLS